MKRRLARLYAVENVLNRFLNLNLDEAPRRSGGSTESETYFFFRRRDVLEDVDDADDLTLGGVGV
jgi:hypothetical protein